MTWLLTIYNSLIKTIYSYKIAEVSGLKTQEHSSPRTFGDYVITSIFFLICSYMPFMVQFLNK